MPADLCEYHRVGFAVATLSAICTCPRMPRRRDPRTASSAQHMLEHRNLTNDHAGRADAAAAVSREDLGRSVPVRIALLRATSPNSAVTRTVLPRSLRRPWPGSATASALRT